MDGDEIEMMVRDDYLEALEGSVVKGDLPVVKPEIESLPSMITPEALGGEELIFEEVPETQFAEEIFSDEDLLVQPGTGSEEIQLPILETGDIQDVRDAVAKDDPILADLPVGMEPPVEIQAIAALEQECELHVAEKRAKDREIKELLASSEVNAVEKIAALEKECERHVQDKTAKDRELQQLLQNEKSIDERLAAMAAETAQRDQKLAEMEKLLDEREKELGIRQKSEAEKAGARKKAIVARMKLAFATALNNLWAAKIDSWKIDSPDGRHHQVAVFIGSVKYGNSVSKDQEPEEPNWDAPNTDASRAAFRALAFKVYDELKAAEEAAKEKPKLTDQEIKEKLARALSIVRGANFSSNAGQDAAALKLFSEL